MLVSVIQDAEGLKLVNIYSKDNGVYFGNLDYPARN
jgi:hypothetical protein